ncbi:hypothetical protein ACWF0M_21665 [Kribbella sp. NPDC055110]
MGSRGAVGAVRGEAEVRGSGGRLQVVVLGAVVVVGHLGDRLPRTVAVAGLHVVVGQERGERLERRPVVVEVDEVLLDVRVQDDDDLGELD